MPQSARQYTAPMIQHLLFVYQFNLDRARTLVADLSDAQMVQQPQGVVNHPAWTLGHLAFVAHHLAVTLGADSTLPEGWNDHFPTGGTPSGDPADYPSKEEILAQLTSQHELAAQAAAGADPTVFEQPFPNERVRKRFPTIGDFAAFLMTSHEAGHLGQIAAWRRAMELGPAG